MTSIIVTDDNLQTAREACMALDQRAELTAGCETWRILYSGQAGQMTVYPSGRGAIMLGSNSVWGDWDAERQILSVESDGVVVFYDRNGCEISD